MATIKEIEAEIKESNEVFDDDLEELRTLINADVKNRQCKAAQDLVCKMIDVQTELVVLYEELYLTQMQSLSLEDELED